MVGTTERESRKGRGPTQAQLTKLLRKNPHLPLRAVADALGVTVQRVRVLASAQGWTKETHTFWSRDD